MARSEVFWKDRENGGKEADVEQARSVVGKGRNQECSYKVQKREHGQGGQEGEQSRKAFVVVSGRGQACCVRVRVCECVCTQ